MASLSTAKTLGGIGAILIFIPFVSLVGYILIIVAVKDISDYLQDRAVFNNILIAAVSGIVGAIAGGLVIVGGAIGGIFTAGISAVLGVLSGLAVVWIALIVSALFLRRAYDTMATRLGVGTFRTAATLYLVGAALTIVFVGFIILLVAEILQAIAYFSIPEQPSVQQAGQAGAASTLPPSPPPAPGGATKFCVSCGNKIAATATFCNSCGAKQP